MIVLYVPKIIQKIMAFLLSPQRNGRIIFLSA